MLVLKMKHVQFFLSVKLLSQTFVYKNEWFCFDVIDKFPDYSLNMVSCLQILYFRYRHLSSEECLKPVPISIHNAVCNMLLLLMKLCKTTPFLQNNYEIKFFLHAFSTKHRILIQFQFILSMVISLRIFGLKNSSK